MKKTLLAALVLLALAPLASPALGQVSASPTPATPNPCYRATSSGCTLVDAGHGLPVVIQGSTPLPTGGATAANQATANASLASIVSNTSTNPTAAGQATANSTLSTIASNTTGASTAANQATANSTLSTISGQLPSSLGPKTAAQSISTAPASDTPPANANQATYSWETVGNSAYATPTDIFCITGSASKTVRVTQIRIGMRSTAAALQTIYFIKRSAANTGGSPTNPTPIKYDSSAVSATATISVYAAAPSPLGASAGNLRVQEIASGVLAGTPGNATMNINFGGPGTQQFQSPVILRGVAESLCINYAGAALTSGWVAGYGVEWTEQ